VPKASDVSADPSLADNTTATYSNATAVVAAGDAYDDWLNLTDAKLAAAAQNVFTAHKAAVEAGYLDFSESGYLRYRLNTDLNITDEVDAISDNYDSWYYDNYYFSATDWRTIDQGLTKLPAAFGPHVFNRTLFNTAVRKMTPIAICDFVFQTNAVFRGGVLQRDHRQGNGRLENHRPILHQAPRDHGLRLYYHSRPLHTRPSLASPSLLLPPLPRNQHPQLGPVL